MKHCPQLAEMAALLRDTREEHLQDVVAGNKKQEWVLVSVILDRFFFCLHFIVIVAMVVFVTLFTNKKLGETER